MNKIKVIQIIEKDDAKIFCVLMKSGLEILSKTRVDLLDPDSHFFFVRPLKITRIHIPAQGPEGLGIKTIVKPEKLTSVLQFDELGFDPHEVWTMSPAPKASADLYLEQTSGIKLS